MAKSVKVRRRGRTTISAKNQVTIPLDALTRAGLKPGDRLVAQDTGPGRITLVREVDPIERFSGALTGTYPDGYLQELRDEWD